MKQFNNVSELIIKHRRIKDISQCSLSQLLGYKNGQFVSNVERGLCTIPFKKLHLVSKLLDIPVNELVEAFKKDTEDSILTEIRFNCVNEGLNFEINGVVK